MVNQSASPGAAAGAALPRLLLALCVASALLISSASAIGVNFGQVANDLPPNDVVLKLIQTASIKTIKLYGADPDVLTTFAGSGIDIVIGADNDQIQPMASTAGYALSWAQTNIAAYPNTSIVGVALGNEVLSSQPELIPFLLPALQNLQTALVALGLDWKVKLSSPNSMDIIANSFPPSHGEFHYYSGNAISHLVEFAAQTGSPFMVNIYPYFAYAAAPANISLDYVLFNPSAVPVYDAGSGLSYTNMLDAQVDAVYAAMSKLGYTDVSLAVSETGWPSAGDPGEEGASPANARLFHANLVQHLESGVGTPAKPGVTVDTYIFALYNEDLKPGPTSERNFGLFNPAGTPVDNLARKLLWYNPPPPVPALPPVSSYPPPPAVPVLPPVSSWPPPPVPVLPPVASWPPPPPAVPVLPPVASWPPPPPAVPVLPPVSSWPPPPPVPALPPVANWPPPPAVPVLPPVSSWPPPPPLAPALPPVVPWPPPYAAVPQPPPQGYSPPPPPAEIATPPAAAYSPPPPVPIVIYTPPAAAPIWSPPPPPVPVVVPTPPADGPAAPSPVDGPPAPIAPAPPLVVNGPTPGPTSPTVPAAPGPAGQSWCVAKAAADPAQLQIALNWACSAGGANCSVLQAGGTCYTPNTLVAHASYAFDNYYELNSRNSWDCFFSDTAEVTTVDPSFTGCAFP